MHYSVFLLPLLAGTSIAAAIATATKDLNGLVPIAATVTKRAAQAEWTGVSYFPSVFDVLTDGYNALPTAIFGPSPTSLLSAIATDIIEAVPTELLNALPTDIIGLLDIPNDIMQAPGSNALSAPLGNPPRLLPGPRFAPAKRRETDVQARSPLSPVEDIVDEAEDIVQTVSEGSGLSPLSQPLLDILKNPPAVFRRLDPSINRNTVSVAKRDLLELVNGTVEQVGGVVTDVVPKLPINPTPVVIIISPVPQGNHTSKRGLLDSASSPISDAERRDGHVDVHGRDVDPQIIDKLTKLLRDNLNEVVEELITIGKGERN